METREMKHGSLLIRVLHGERPRDVRVPALTRVGVTNYATRGTPRACPFTAGTAKLDLHACRSIVQRLCPLLAGPDD